MQSPVVAQNSPIRSPHVNATPQSRKRRRVDNQENVVKNVRFALDENNRRAEPTTPTSTTAAAAAAHAGDPDDDVIPAGRFPSSSDGEFMHPENFHKVSPKKPVMEMGANTLIVCSSPTGQEAARLGLTTPSPLILTPRRSAMKRRLIDEAAQRPLTDSACTTPTDFRAPSVPTSASRKKTLMQVEGCLYPRLRSSNHSIHQLCLQLAAPTRQRNLANHLKEMGITKIGEFASLSPSKVEEIPYLRRPKVDGAVNVLRTFAQNQAAAQQSSTADSGGPSNPLVHVDSSEKEAASPVESLTVDDPQEYGQEERPETPIQPEIVAENNEAEAARSRAAAADMQDTMEIVKTSPPTEIEERNEQPRGAPLVPRTQAPVVTSSQQSGGTASGWTDSSSEVNYARFQELQEKAADLSNLLNTTISAISKPKPSPIKMLRNIRAQLRDAAVSKTDCDQMLDLIMDLAKDVNQRRRTLADD